MSHRAKSGGAKSDILKVLLCSLWFTDNFLCCLYFCHCWLPTVIVGLWSSAGGPRGHIRHFTASHLVLWRHDWSFSSFSNISKTVPEHLSGNYKFMRWAKGTKKSGMRGRSKPGMTWEFYLFYFFYHLSYPSLLLFLFPFSLARISCNSNWN